jgi:hypothetical protein
MTYSLTITETNSFTATHARHMAAKVATDLKRMQRFYNVPSDQEITDYETEAIELLKNGYLGTITYGFQRDGKWIEPTLKYTAKDLAGFSANDDDPGRIHPNANVEGARFHNFLTYSSEWDKLSYDEKSKFKSGLPFQRTSGEEPGIEGFFYDDKIYSSGGRALNRSTVRSY